ncbi:MAG: hypothetical protein QOH21_719 [Acidobacteriota bacterium]|nr:hypothetical protein [Acidobacteriota bacterium]
MAPPSNVSSIPAPHASHVTTLSYDDPNQRARSAISSRSRAGMGSVSAPSAAPAARSSNSGRAAGCVSCAASHTDSSSRSPINVS